jgi:hypothetical protein
MKQFINLARTVINKLHIAEITRSPQKYRIYMSNNNLSGALIFSSGYISSIYNVVEVCEQENPLDYKKITDFINSESE